jgi:hypothetical protein
MTAVLGFVKSGDHEVNADGCDEESAASMMLLSNVFNAAQVLVLGDTSSLNVSATRHKSISEGVDCEVWMAWLR